MPSLATAEDASPRHTPHWAGVLLKTDCIDSNESSSHTTTWLASWAGRAAARSHASQLPASWSWATRVHCSDAV